MARRITSWTTVTPVAVADATTMTTASPTGDVWLGGIASQYTRFWEISISGQATSSSSPTFMLFSRDSTVHATPAIGTGNVDAAMDPGTIALANPLLVSGTWTTYGQRATAGHLMNCSLNAFGGVFFWRANRAEECPAMLGVTQPLGECSLSAFTGGTPGAVGMHVIYETS